MRITKCRVNHLENPIGYDFRSLTFSWVVLDAEGENPFHLKYRITIKNEEKLVYQTEWDELNPLGASVDYSPKPRTCYRWSLDVRHSDGTEESLECGTFETGKMNEPWKGKWISCAQEERHPWFYKGFSIPETGHIKKARLYITGLGLYEAYLNGEKVGDEFLTPGCTSYQHWVQVQTYDVTNMIKEQNQLSVLLGNGWYKGRFGFWNRESEYRNKKWEMLAELHITMEDDSEILIPTDESWQVERSNIISSGIYSGEIVDDTLPKRPAEPVLLSQGPQICVKDRLGIPVRAQEHFKAKQITTPLGETVLDLGQNHAGLFTIRVHEPYGTRIRIQVGEVLQDGNFYRDNLRSAEAEFVYISDGNQHLLRPHFTFYGYRYAKLEGFTHFTEDDFDGFAIYSDFEQRGQIQTGHKGLNQLISNTFWGMKSNFVDVPTDCPQRDERMGWTGDAQVFSPTAQYYADVYAFYTKYLYDCGMEQQERNGKVPDVVPSFGQNGCSCGWGDATCIIPWNMYLFTGDKTILQQHFDYMKAWVDYIEGVDGQDHGWRKVFHYGDWLALDCPYFGQNQVRGGTEEGFIADVYYHKSLLLVAKAAEVLGKADEKRRYEEKAKKVLCEIRKEYYSETGRCCIPTQTAAVLTLQEHLHDEKRALEQLLTLLEYRQGKLSTGFIGTPLLCEALASYGQERAAYQILLNEEYPGWLAEIKLGATTVWERWNSLDETGHISSTGMNSLNHYAYGSVVSWIWSGCAGLSPLEEKPGFRKVRIAPKVNYKLQKVDARYESPAGTYHIFWEILGEDTIHLKLEIPAGCEAVVELPYGDMQALQREWKENPLIDKCAANEPVTEGCYEVSYKAKEPLIPVFTVDSNLQDMLCDQDVRRVLYREVPKVEEYFPFGRSCSLRETMDNYGDGSEEIYAKLNEELKKALRSL